MSMSFGSQGLHHVRVLFQASSPEVDRGGVGPELHHVSRPRPISRCQDVGGEVVMLDIVGARMWSIHPTREAIYRRLMATTPFSELSPLEVQMLICCRPYEILQPRCFTLRTDHCRGVDILGDKQPC